MLAPGAGRIGNWDDRGHKYQTLRILPHLCTYCHPRAPFPGDRDRWQSESPASMGGPWAKRCKKVSLERGLFKTLRGQKCPGCDRPCKVLWRGGTDMMGDSHSELPAVLGAGKAEVCRCALGSK